MGLLDVRIEIARGSHWRSRHQRIASLKSANHNQVNDPTTSSTSSISQSAIDNGEIHPADRDTSSPTSDQEETKISQLMPLELYRSAATEDVDRFIGVIEQTAAERGLSLVDILHTVSPSGNTLLHIAANNKNQRNAMLLIYHAPSLLLTQNTAGDTPLHLAMRSGDKSLAWIFITFINHKSAGPRFHESWSEVAGPLPNIVQSLRLRNRKGNTPLHDSVVIPCYQAVSTFSHEDPEVCQFLNNEGKSPLSLAVEAGDVDSVITMISYLKKISTEHKFSRQSPLQPAIIKGNQGLIEKILEHDPALINQADEEGEVPLHYAASVGCVDMVRYILGKDVECILKRAKNGLFPIHMAAYHGHIQVIKELLIHCPDPRELLTRDGQNILHIAATKGNDNVVNFVLQTTRLEFLINEQDSHGNTPLHLATINWHPKIVYTLTWDKRVTMETINNEGFTALDAAEYYMNKPPSFDKPLTWTALKAVGAPRSQKRDSPNSCLRDPRDSLPSNISNVDNYKDRVNTLLVVATLVATVTFAAGFTVPGGYNNSNPNEGMATMLEKKAFQVFILANTTAMYSSILVVVSLIWAQLGDVILMFNTLRLAIPLLGVALAMMSLAFLAGIYVTVSQLQWLAYTILSMGFTFLVAFLALFYPLCCPISSSNHFLRYISFWSLKLLILVTQQAR